MMAYSAHATNPIFSQQLTYDADKDFTPIVFVGYIPLILVTHPQSGLIRCRRCSRSRARSPEQLRTHRAAPALARIYRELLKYSAKVDLVHVPYKGNAPALNDILGNQVPIMFDTITTALPHVKAGKLRALAVTSPKRSPLAPDVPTMIEAGLKDFDISAWYMVLAPRGTPPAVVQKLNAEINKAMQDPEVRDKLGSQGVDFVGGTPEEAQKFMRSEIERWARVAKITGMKGN